MVLNRKQKIVIVVTVVLLILSFLFPPWGDTGPGVIKFIGYSSIFNSPTHYQWEHVVTTDYSKNAEEILSHRRQDLSEVWQDNSSSSKLQDWPYTSAQEDSILQKGTFKKRVNKEIGGWATIYHQLLLIQIGVIGFISVLLLMFFQMKL